MSAFYGNIKNNSRASFIFDRTYANRKAMEDNMKEDKIFNGRYILVEYGEKRFTQYLDVSNKFYKTGGDTSPIEQPDPSVVYYTYNKTDKVYERISPDDINIDKFQSIIQNGGKIFEKLDHEFLDETCEYYKNRLIDETEYQDCYDSTVWQKIWTNVKQQDGTYIGQEKYIMVAELNAIAPTLDLIVDAPSDDPQMQQPHFDKVFSTDLDYKFHVPMNWRIDSDVTFDYNADGFDPAQRSNTGTTSQVGWDNVRQEDSPQYPEHVKVGQDASGKDIIAGLYENGVLKTSNQNDTKQLNLNLSDLGNLASDFWDLVYPSEFVLADEDGKLTNTQFNSLKANLFIRAESGVYEPIGDAPYDSTAIYYVADPSRRRNTDISNRDGSSSIPKSTIADLINNIYYLYGLSADNEFQDILDNEPTTIYGLFNAFKDLFGSPSDQLDANHFIPVSNAGWFTTGTTNNSNFDKWHNNNYGPLYIRDSMVDADENVYIMFIPAKTFDATAQYYIDTNTLWAQLKNFRDNREDNQSDWTEDLPDSISYIKHKPSVVFATESEINTAYPNEDLELIQDTFEAENVPFNVDDLINPHSIDERWGEIIMNKSNVSIIDDVYDQTGDSLSATVLTEAGVLEAIAEAEAEL